MILYGSVLPTFDPDRKKKAGNGRTIDAGDPKNNELLKTMFG